MSSIGSTSSPDEQHPDLAATEAQTLLATSTWPSCTAATRRAQTDSNLSDTDVSTVNRRDWM